MNYCSGIQPRLIIKIDSYNCMGDRWNEDSKTDYLCEGDLINNKLASETLVSKIKKESRYVIKDIRGSLEQLTCQTGLKDKMFEYTAFGELKTDVSINDIHGFTGYVNDKETRLYYANARMYNPQMSKFMSKDILRVDSLNRYLYVVNNPVNLVDPSGMMSPDTLNAISIAHSLGYMDNNQVFALVLLINAFTSKLQILHNFDNGIESALDDLFDIPEFLKNDSVDYDDKDITKQSVFLSFHETAQILAAKEIYVNRDKYLASCNETGDISSRISSVFGDIMGEEIVNRKLLELFCKQQNIPILEKRDLAWGRKEADIVFKNLVWEVKPITAGEAAYKKSLEKYLTGNYVAGGWLDGISSAKIKLGTSSVEILTYSIGLGKIQYALKLNNEQKSTVEVAEAILANEDFNSIYETKENFAKVGVVLAGVVIGVAALTQGNSEILNNAITELEILFPTLVPAF